MGPSVGLQQVMSPAKGTESQVSILVLDVG